MGNARVGSARVENAHVGTGAFARPGRDGLCRGYAFGRPYRCSVFPLNNSIACGTNAATASSDSTAPAGLPGKLRIKARSRTPHTPRLSAANGVFLLPSLRICSATPSSSSSSGSHDESHLARQPNQHVLNLNGVIRNYFAHGNREVKLLQNLRHCRTREILALPASARIADRHYSGRDVPRFSHRGGHLPLLPFGLCPQALKAHWEHWA